MSLKNKKIAIVCEWLTNLGGAERVNLTLHKMFPEAPVFTCIYNQKNIPDFKDTDIRTSFLQYMPFAKKKHQFYLSFMPLAYERFDLSEFDIVISSSFACSKGIITKPSCMHVCYCHTPMRYVWDEWQNYLRNYKVNRVVKRVVPNMLHKLRIWDRMAADRVDYYIANSDFIKQRIKKYYKHDAEVINPPVNFNEFNSSREIGDYYLAGGRLTAYKKFDLLVDAFNELGLKLKIFGTGESLKDLEKVAKKNVQFLGRVSDTELKELYSKAKAFIFPQIEDFGIVPLEAMASGRPVIALKAGGALETVVDKKTGVFFGEQSVKSLKEAVNRFEKMTFDSQKILNHAKKFDVSVFEQKILDFLEKKWYYWERNMT